MNKIKIQLDQRGIDLLKAEADRYTEKIAYRASEVAKELCPVDTGKLKNSIRVEKVAEGQYAYGSDLDYALSVELGTADRLPQPFLRDALVIVSSEENGI